MLWLVLVTKGATVGAFVFQLLEFFSQFVEEIEYLWKARIRPITYLYAWSRYFPLCAQIVNFVVSEFVGRSPNPRLCMTAFILRGLTTQLTTTGVETILILRVYALYNRTRRTRIFLFVILIIGTTVEVSGTIMALAELQPQAGIGGSICIPGQCSARTLSLFAAGCGLIQGVTLFMTGSKVYHSRKNGWTRTPVISLMLRDGISTFVLLAVAISSLMTFESVRSMGVLLWNATSSWYVSLVSMSGCRMVLSMRKLGATHPRHRQLEDNTQAEFSTIIDWDESELSHNSFDD